MARLQKKKTPAVKGKRKDRTVDAQEVAQGAPGSEKQAKATTAGRGIKAAAKSKEKQSKAALGSTAAQQEPNAIQKGIQFLREVKVELKKVTWPNRKQTAGSTVVVIILVFIIASFLGLVDFGLSKLVQIVLA